MKKSKFDFAFSHDNQRFQGQKCRSSTHMYEDKGNNND